MGAAAVRRSQAVPFVQSRFNEMLPGFLSLMDDGWPTSRTSLVNAEVLHSALSVLRLDLAVLHRRRMAITDGGETEKNYSTLAPDGKLMAVDA